MTKQEFITEFTLRALTQIQVLEASDEAYYIRTSIRIANDAWAAMQAANQPPLATDLKPSNSVELKQLAQLAAEQGFEWIAQDKCRIWYGYKIKPEFRRYLQEWRSKGNNNWAALNLPDNTDYSKECYRISDILGTE